MNKKPIDITPTVYNINGLNGNNLPQDIAHTLSKAIEKKNSGRANTFTEEKGITILEALVAGDTNEEAAEKAGISIATYYVWRQLVPGFLEYTTQARKLGIETRIEKKQKRISDMDPAKLDAKTAQAVIRHAEVDFRTTHDLAKCYNFELYGDKKHNLNVNLNARVSDEDVSQWFNK